jgi:hypothetical protein
MSIELNDIIIPARDALEDQLLAIIPDHPGLPDPMMATSTGTAGLLWLWDAVDAHVIMGSVLPGHRGPRPGTGIDGVPADLRHQRLRARGVDAQVDAGVRPAPADYLHDRAARCFAQARQQRVAWQLAALARASRRARRPERRMRQATRRVRQLRAAGAVTAQRASRPR